HITGSSHSFYMYDDQAAREGEWLSIYVYDSGGYDPVIGDLVSITGLVVEYNGVTELDITISNSIMQVQSSGDRPASFPMSTANIPYNTGAISEPYEGTFVNLENLTITQVNDYDFLIVDNSGVEAQVSTGDMLSEYVPVVDETINQLQGFVHYAYNAYQLYIADTSAVPTSVEDESNSGLIRFALRQNYPNPFNPSTAISFSLPVNSHVALKIFNINGQLVKSLVDDNFKLGHYTVDWEGRNDRGQAVSSGVYFYRLKTDEFKAYKRMVLMK
ncbi:MAG: T9SS type A sorting domain-containing protein, partial [Planctomycetes bacterium]|nr:T9SS type A sorting domain-containing protein [Planctomycetota bacterium]